MMMVLCLTESRIIKTTNPDCTIFYYHLLFPFFLGIILIAITIDMNVMLGVPVLSLA
jgi:hypothetical protein